MTYSKLLERANNVANQLRSHGVQKGDRVMIVYPPGLAFLEGFMGCLMAGAIACIVYPPNPFDRKKGAAKKSFQVFAQQAQDAGATHALTVSEFRAAIVLQRFPTGVKWLVSNGKQSSLKKRVASSLETTGTTLPDDIAFIQYTSGSTGTPKGVMISHGAVVHNLLTIGRVSDIILDDSPPSLGCSWLPQYHDYGLINFFLGPLYDVRFPSINFSPIDFIQNPILWADLLDEHQPTHTAAPNFSYALLAKRFKACGRKLKNSNLRRANIAAEPIALSTLTLMTDDIGIPQEAINPCYGMSESCVYVTSTLGTEEVQVNDSGAVACGLISRTEAHEKQLIIVKDGQQVGDGVEGEIHINGPDLSSGYWNKPELTKACFENVFDGQTFFATGDLGIVEDGKLYVMGRSKEMIIINGRNIFPYDLERAIDAEFPLTVRPGSTVVYQHDDHNLGVAMELRDKQTADAPSPTVASVRSILSEFPVSSVFLLKQGSVPKTTSGKLKRGACQQICREGTWDSKQVLLHWDKQGDAVENRAMNDDHLESLVGRADKYPADRLPQIAVDTVRAIKCNKQKLEDAFLALDFGGVPGIMEAWKDLDKSTEALQAMCDKSIEAFQEGYPTAVKLCHLLVQPENGLLQEEAGILQLEEIVHCGYVLEWATKLLASNPRFLEQKVALDHEFETRALQNTKSVKVPDDARFLLNGIDSDPLYGVLDTFHWMKHRSVELLVSLILKSIHQNEVVSEVAVSENETIAIGDLNVLEAVWLDFSLGRKDNASVGHWLCNRSSFESRMEDGLPKLCFGQEKWTPVYAAWNLALMTSFGNPQWVLSKWLIPCMASPPSDSFFVYRGISLYLTSQQRLREHMSGSVAAPRLLSEDATKAFGKLNLKWAFDQSHDSKLDWNPSTDSKPPDDTATWLERFGKWHAQRSESGERTTSKKYSNFDDLVSDFFGITDCNMDQPWQELGLSSLAAVELRNVISDSFAVTLPPDCFEVYSTPNSLKKYILIQQGSFLPLLLPELAQIGRKMKSAWLASILQIVGVLSIFLLFGGAIVPAYYFGSWAASESTIELVNINERWMKWLWLPVAVPTWMLSFTAITILSKWLVIGRYRPCQTCIGSLLYLRWWWVDRLVHIWEQWVGVFFLGTPLLWATYYLMGARIHPSVRLDIFLREFDLVEIGEGARMEESSTVKCRKFLNKEGLSFRPASVGSDCIIYGMLEPGASVESKSYLAPRSVLVEGTQAPGHSELVGNPAVKVSEWHGISHKRATWWLVDLLKLLWSVVTLYMMFSLNLISQMALNGRFPTNWRYSDLFYWITVIFLSALLILPMNVAMKWLLIGKRSPGNFSETAVQVANDWVVDMHFKIFYKIASVPWKAHWRFWNVVLCLYGMDIDMSSQVGTPSSVVPSKVDLIKIRRSYVSSAAVKFVNVLNGQRMQSEIVDSSIGALAIVGPGVKLFKTVVPPTEYAQTSMTGTAAQKPYRYSWCEVATQTLVTICWMALVLLSFIPPFLFSKWALRLANPAGGAFGVGAAIGIQTFTSLLIWILMEKIAFPGSALQSPWNVPIFDLHLGSSAVIQLYTLMPVLWGTPLWTYLMRIMGGTVGEDVIFLGQYQCGICYHQIEAGTVIDGAHIIGHNAVGSNYRLGSTHVSGVLNEGSFSFAGTSTTIGTSAWRVCTQSFASKLDPTGELSATIEEV